MCATSSRKLHSYDGDEGFLAGPPRVTDKLAGCPAEAAKAERARAACWTLETGRQRPDAYGPGCIVKTEGSGADRGPGANKPLKRAFMPLRRHQDGPSRLTRLGYQLARELHKIFTDYRTHNRAVFDAYTR